MHEIKNFNLLLAELEDGQFNADVSDKMQEVVKALTTSVLESGTKRAKGFLAITLDFTLDSGNMLISGSMASKLPSKPRGRSLFWTTKDNGLSRENPKQPALPFETITGGKKECASLSKTAEEA